MRSWGEERAEAVWGEVSHGMDQRCPLRTVGFALEALQETGVAVTFRVTLKIETWDRAHLDSLVQI